MKALALTLMTTLAITLLVASPANAEIAWQNNLRTAHAKAQAEGKLLLLHFFTDNCGWCDKLEAGAFQDSGVNEALATNFVAVKVHAGQSPKLAEMFKVSSFPTDVIVTTEGKTIAHGVSPQEPTRYIAMLASTLSNLPAKSALPEGSTMLASTGTNTAQDPAPEPTSVPGPAVETPVDPKATAEPVAAAAQGGSGNWDLPEGTAAIAQNKLASSRSSAQETSAPESKPTNPSSADVQRVSANISTPTSVETTVAGQISSQPELAMDGYCAVTVVDDAKWVEGSPEFGVLHLGKLYLFANKEKMQKFLDEPIPYTPVLNEIDVVRFFEERVIVQGKREWALQDPTHRRMFFFADKAAMLHFEDTYDRYVDSAMKVMETAIRESNP